MNALGVLSCFSTLLTVVPAQVPNQREDLVTRTFRLRASATKSPPVIESAYVRNTGPGTADAELEFLRVLRQALTPRLGTLEFFTKKNLIVVKDTKTVVDEIERIIRQANEPAHRVRLAVRCTEVRVPIPFPRNFSDEFIADDTGTGPFVQPDRGPWSRLVVENHRNASFPIAGHPHHRLAVVPHVVSGTGSIVLDLVPEWVGGIHGKPMLAIGGDGGEVPLPSIANARDVQAVLQSGETVVLDRVASTGNGKELRVELRAELIPAGQAQRVYLDVRFARLATPKPEPDWEDAAWGSVLRAGRIPTRLPFDLGECHEDVLRQVTEALAEFEEPTASEIMSAGICVAPERWSAEFLVSEKLHHALVHDRRKGQSGSLVLPTDPLEEYERETGLKHEGTPHFTMDVVPRVVSDSNEVVLDVTFCPDRMRTKRLQTSSGKTAVVRAPTDGRTILFITPFVIPLEENAGDFYRALNARVSWWVVRARPPGR